MPYLVVSDFCYWSLGRCLAQQVEEESGMPRGRLLSRKACCGEPGVRFTFSSWIHLSSWTQSPKAPMMKKVLMMTHAGIICRCRQDRRSGSPQRVDGGSSVGAIKSGCPSGKWRSCQKRSWSSSCRFENNIKYFIIFTCCLPILKIGRRFSDFLGPSLSEFWIWGFGSFTFLCSNLAWTSLRDYSWIIL